MSRHAPDPTERAALSERLEAIHGGLASADKGEVATTLLRFLAGFPSLKSTAQDMARLVDVFVVALAGLPLWAIRQACLDWARGKGRNDGFPPTSGELRAVAEEIVRPYRIEAGELSAILSAEVKAEPDYAARDAAIERWEREIKPLLRGNVVEDREARKRAGERLVQVTDRMIEAELKAKGIGDGLKVSAELRAKLSSYAEQYKGDTA